MLIIIIFLCIFISYRNDEVFQFRHKIFKMAWDATEKRILRNEINVRIPYELYNKYSENDMLYSFKPLILEAWYTKEEIKLLKGE